MVTLDAPNLTIVIAAEPDEVFPHFCRPELIQRWSLGIKSVQVIQGDACAPGSVLVSKMSWSSGVRKAHTRVIESNPPWKFVTEEQIGGVTAIQTSVLEKVAEGTKVVCTLQVAKRGGIYGFMLRLQPDVFTKQLGVLLPRLKKAVEEPDKSRSTRGFRGHLWESLKASPRLSLKGFLACFVGSYLIVAVIKVLVS